MKSVEFDKFLSENCVKPTWAIMSSKLWNGYWRVKRTNKFLRWLGRKTKSKRIYWLGFQLVWESGLKDFQDFVDWAAEEIGFNG